MWSSWIRACSESNDNCPLKRRGGRRERKDSGRDGAAASVRRCQELPAATRSFPGGPRGKELACQCRRLSDMGSISGSGRCPGDGNGNLLQNPCLENPRDRGAWQAVVLRVAELDATEVTQHTHQKRGGKVEEILCRASEGPTLLTP